MATSDDLHSATGDAFRLAIDSWQEPLERAVPGAVAQAAKDARAAFETEVPALQTWDFGPPQLNELRVPMLSVVHEDPWPGFAEVHQALVAAGAHAALLPIRSHLLQMLDPDLVADSIAGFLSAAQPAPRAS